MLYHSVARVAMYLYKNKVEEVSFFVREKLLYDSHELCNLGLYIFTSMSWSRVGPPLYSTVCVTETRAVT
jgi:hypothetical protein